ncbi:hypothetical protein TraAM80_09542 [Trypanosoma rangeli]|uniref:Uncharacterized protein n=1 Tax=Trypanosoma rangeli TaxID=5698 RepID=A0A3R7R6V6_TRYRA|nr:uncharacterized protein TraAM80_09542 [Trypanosoma rangeli]RNE96999.1 hypothetical protein TraAM80_09542 [Trypanosoma rangeli]|eukprot:RNE96999.1 hypothetical protein TraAM80_09542 [Trypanosoma rangeli]
MKRGKPPHRLPPHPGGGTKEAPSPETKDLLLLFGDVALGCGRGAMFLPAPCPAAPAFGRCVFRRARRPPRFFCLAAAKPRIQKKRKARAKPFWYSYGARQDAVWGAALVGKARPPAGVRPLARGLAKLGEGPQRNCGWPGHTKQAGTPRCLATPKAAPPNRGTAMATAAGKPGEKAICL